MNLLVTDSCRLSLSSRRTLLVNPSLSSSFGNSRLIVPLNEVECKLPSSWADSWWHFQHSGRQDIHSSHQRRRWERKRQILSFQSSYIHSLFIFFFFFFRSKEATQVKKKKDEKKTCYNTAPTKKGQKRTPQRMFDLLFPLFFFTFNPSASFSLRLLF